jgi:hypothetical protein
MLHRSSPLRAVTAPCHPVSGQHPPGATSGRAPRRRPQPGLIRADYLPCSDDWRCSRCPEKASKRWKMPDYVDLRATLWQDDSGGSGLTAAPAGTGSRWHSKPSPHMLMLTRGSTRNDSTTSAGHRDPPAGAVLTGGAFGASAALLSWLIG